MSRQLEGWEDLYLASVMLGGKVQEITLSGKREYIHKKIKEKIEKGVDYIPFGVISGTENYTELNAKPYLTNSYCNEIRDLQKQIALSEIIKKKDREGSVEDKAAQIAAELEKVLQEQGRENILLHGRELFEKETKPFPDVITGLFPVGLNVLFSPPKIGKTFFCLLAAHNVAFGRKFLDRNVLKSNVIYYAIEEGFYGLKSKWETFAGSQTVPDGLYFRERLKDNRQIISDIKNTGARLVFLDTFIRCEKIKNMNDYAETSSIAGELKEIADSTGTAIVCVHHASKSKREKNNDDWTTWAMGSQGLIGAADGISMIDVERGNQYGKLRITGRLIKDSHIMLHNNECSWELGYEDLK